MSDKLREEIQCDIAAAFPEHFQNAAEGEDYATAEKLEKLAESNVAKVREHDAEHSITLSEPADVIRAKTIEQVLAAVESERFWLGGEATNYMINKIKGVSDE